MIAIIPARGGSRRIPLKNIRDFHGHPMLSYAINNAQQSKLFDEIVVSTDDDEIAGVAEEHGAGVHWRDSYASRDEVGTQEVAGRVVDDLGIRVGWACVLYATTPLLLPSDLVDGYEAALRRMYYAVSVGINPLRDAGAFYFGMAVHFHKRSPLHTHNTVYHPLPDSRVCDINTHDDWFKAEKMYEEART